MRHSVCVVVLLLAGCDRSESRAVGTVRGRVTFQGQSLAGGWVVFTPHTDKGSPGRAVFAEIDEAGEYKLAAGSSPYIAAGWYRIAIAEPATWTTPATTNRPQLAYVSPFPDSLRRPDRSGLEHEVLAGRENVFDFFIELNR